MRKATHFQWGYIAQGCSVLMLGLANVVLPNWLGVVPYAQLTAFLACVGLTSTMFHEGVTLLTIRRIMQDGATLAESSAIALRAALEHVLLVLLMLSGVVLASGAIAPNLHYTTGDWVLVVATAVLVAAYAPCLAWMVANHRNDWVTQLTLLHGLLSLILPIGLYYVGADVRWSVVCSYLGVVGICLGAMHSVGVGSILRNFTGKRRVCLRWTVVAGSVPTIMSVAMLSVPVLALYIRQDIGTVATYKIGLSMASAALMAVPFSRRTVLSLPRQDDAGLLSLLSEAAVMISAAGAVALIVLAEPLTHLLYDRAFSELAVMLPAFGVFIVLHIMADAVLLQAMMANAESALLAACAVGMISMTASVAFLPVQWIPAVTLGAFLVVAVAELRRKGIAWSKFPLRSGLVGLTASFAAVLQQPWGAVLAAAVLVVATVSVARLWRSMVVMKDQLVGYRRRGSNGLLLWATER
jgi:hypothetical protein